MFQFLLFCSVAMANEEVPEVTKPAEAASASENSEATASPQVDEALLHRLEAAAHYKVGLELVTQGRYDEAGVRFSEVVERYSDTDIKARAEEQIRLLGSLQEGRIPRSVVDQKAYEEEGWAELAINQGLAMPLILGFLLPAGTTQPEEPGIPVALGMVGLGVGVGGSYLLDQKIGITRGQAMAVFSGEAVGFLNGYMLSAITQPRDYRGHYRYMMAGTLLGGAGAVALDHYLELDSGQMAMANSGALWGAVLGLTSMVFFEVNDDADVWIRLVSALDLGLVTGALLTQKWDISRKRMGVINLSAVAGAGLGLGFGFFGSFYGNMDEESFTLLMLGSTAGGALLGAYLSRNMDADGGDKISALLRLNDGGWEFGTPLPTPMFTPDGGMGLGVSLAHGRF